MNIHAKKGEKVIFKYPTAGHKHDHELVKKHLSLNKFYTVDKTVVGEYHTDVYLEEFPNIVFNSVNFESEQEEELKLDFDNIEEMSKIDYLKEMALDRGYIIKTQGNKAYVFKVVAIAEENSELEAAEAAMSYVISNPLD